MSAITLPTHYYLDHGLEVFDYLEAHCLHLLPSEALSYIRSFRALNRDEQCLLVRLWSRKPRFLKRSSLMYAEITQPYECLETLKNVGLANDLSFMNSDDSLFNSLTKPELLSILDGVGARAPASTSKASLVGMCLTWRSENNNIEPELDVLDQYVERSQQDVVDYLLFLFFGDLRNRFQRFSMRDLGVLSTKNKAKDAQQVARFISLDEARHEFECHTHLRDISQGSVRYKELLKFLKGDSMPSFQSVRKFSSASRDRLVLKLGEQLLAEQPQAAIDVWQLSEQADVLEKRLRLQYQMGDTEQVKLELELLQERAQEQGMSAASEIFIADFYARKFTGKRTSIYTDMLRNAAESIGVDELYLNSSEQGVIAYYQRIGAHAEFVENKVWRAFFALLFWDLLFEQDGAQANEFDRLPLVLQRSDFYTRFEKAINDQLKILDEPLRSRKYFTRMAVSKHGYPTGLFRWSETVLSTMLLVLKHAPADALAKVMMRMARDYKNTKDGYPDILVLDENGLRFEEVKAPGDVIRPNQLVSINRLQRAGFTVLIRPVHWTTDPNQVYAVVDIETTGGRQNGNAITEVAVVKLKDKKVIDECSTLVKPNRSIHRHITHLTGISNAMVEDAPIFAEIADQLKKQLEGCVFVAHNVGFDYGFIKAAYLAIDRSFSMPKLCTVRNARKAFPGLKSYSLGKLVEHFDIDLKNHHRALDDARATAHLLTLIQEQDNE